MTPAADEFTRANGAYVYAQRLGARSGEALEVTSRGTPLGHVIGFCIGAALAALAVFVWGI